MELDFYKFHGAGNDFIMVDNRIEKPITTTTIEQLCHRRTGIGADGLILLEKADNADFKMRYFNANGIEASFCGNGGRCIVAFAQQLKIVELSCVFQAYDGLHSAEIISEKGENPAIIQLEMKNGHSLQTFADGWFIDTGSPHFVQFSDNIMEGNILLKGNKLRHDKRFPNGANINFVMPYRDGIFVRTYERGVENETLSCGTGVTAAAQIHAIRNEWHAPWKLAVYTQGGTFTVNCDCIDEEEYISLTGSAKYVFMGKINI